MRGPSRAAILAMQTKAETPTGYPTGDQCNKRHGEFWIRAARAQYGEVTALPGYPIVRMVEGWARYADSHRERFESSIGEDYVLGPEWESIGKSLLALLNGEIQPLDGGLTDGVIRDILKANDCDGES